MDKLVPHPLVTRVALKLAQDNVGTLKPFADALVQKVAGRGNRVTSATWTQAAKKAKDEAHVAEKDDLARDYANQANLNGLSLFAGLLGGPVRDDTNEWWRLVYLDSRLDSWMLVPSRAIIAWERLKDDNAPSGVRDVLWVDSTANLVTGSGPRTNDGRFLVGELTSAGEFAPSTSGGTFSAASGLLCEATTPGCCRVTRTRC